MLLTPNEYSRAWYEVFLQSVPQVITDAEVAFIIRHLPPADFPRLLDVCCGPGRHALRLADSGYTILGIDKNLDAIHAEQSRSPHLTFQVHDMREIESLQASFDGALNLWQSFGYFDDATNVDVLRQLRDKLVPGGRFILDVYNRECLEQFPAEQVVQRQGREILTRRTWNGNRMTTVLSYDGEPGDVFEWRLYTRDEIVSITTDLGFRPVVECAGFDEAIPPSREHPRIQLVLERAT